MKRNLCIFFLCMFSTMAFSQTWNQYKKEAKKAFQNEEFGTDFVLFGHDAKNR